MNDMTSVTPSYLEAWFSQKPTIGLMGEFSAGKSTLLNLMLDDSILQTRVTATNMPVIWLTYAETPQAQSLSREGLLESFDLDALNEQGDKDHLLIRLALPCEILKQADVIDTPGISDGRLSAKALAFLGPFLDSVIWCSPANQAWRQTEKAMWTSLPEDLRSKSFMALTRADTLRKANDLKKVLRRCERETVDLFNKVIPVSAVKALEARDTGSKISDQAKWDKSNADTFLSEVNDVIAQAIKACNDRPDVSLPETVVQPQAEAPVIDAPKPEKKAEKKPASKPKAASKPRIKPAKTEKPAKAAKKPTPAGDLSTLNSELCQLVETSSQNGQFVEQLNHILNAFAGHKDLSEGQRMVLNQTMSLTLSDDVPATRVISQVKRELNDFANGPWHKLE